MSGMEKALNAQEKVLEAQAGVNKAKIALTEATDAYRKASAELISVLEEGKNENTAELQSEALDMHMEMLHQELQSAVADKRYSEAASIAQKMGQMNEPDAEAIPAEEEGQEKTELEKAVDDFIAENNIDGETDQMHYRERAKFIASQNGEDVSAEDIIDALQREFEKAKINVPKADPSWADRRAA